MVRPFFPGWRPRDAISTRENSWKTLLEKQKPAGEFPPMILYSAVQVACRPKCSGTARACLIRPSRGVGVLQYMWSLRDWSGLKRACAVRYCTCNCRGRFDGGPGHLEVLVPSGGAAVFDFVLAIDSLALGFAYFCCYFRRYSYLVFYVPLHYDTVSTMRFFRRPGVRTTVLIEAPSVGCTSGRRCSHGPGGV